MSELGSNKGQDENKNTTVFDSANLAEKQNTEHFAKVEGAEVRKKAAEREVKAAEKKAEKAHKDAVKNAAKKANKEAGDSKKKKPIIIIAAIALLLIGAVLLAIFVGGDSEEKQIATDEAAQEYALEVYRDIEDTQINESLDAAREKMETAIENGTEEQKIYLSIYYAEFLASKTNDAVLARKWLEEAESHCKNDKELTDVRDEYAGIAMILGDQDFNIYSNQESE